MDKIDSHRPRAVGLGSLLIRALICIIIGAVLNILVAWGFALFHAPTGTLSEHVMREPRWPVPVPSNLRPPKSWTEQNAPGHHIWTIIEAGPPMATPPPAPATLPGSAPPNTNPFVSSLVTNLWGAEIKAHASGWPALSFVRWSSTAITPSLRSDGINIAGIKRAIPSIQTDRLPVHPLWRGVAINSVVLALPAAVFLVAPRLARRISRAVRHQCPACGYDARGLDRCPECGRAARPRP